jgi:hypothetical protein
LNLIKDGRELSKTDLSLNFNEIWLQIFNKHLRKEIFRFKTIEVKQADIKELVNEAVEKVVEFA